MKKYVLLSCIAAFLGIGLYGWHLYMKANWDAHMNIEQDIFRIIKKESGGIPSVVNTDELPDNYKANIEIVRNGDDYIIVSGNNQKLTKDVVSEEMVSKGKPTGNFHEFYIYKSLTH